MLESHVYSDGNNYVVASSPVEAYRLYLAIGLTEDDAPFKDWRQLSDDAQLTVIDDAVETTHIHAEWVRLRGKGYLCSLDY
jgi:hypothetical protein